MEQGRREKEHDPEKGTLGIQYRILAKNIITRNVYYPLSFTSSRACAVLELS